jgi:coenzyme F420-reducing hydrogenase gamma subunit
MSENPIHPMHAVWAGLAAAPRCGAHCRTTGQPCKNPEMANGRCRMHGGKSTGAPRGEQHYRYRHGGRTVEALQHRREVRAQIRLLLELMRD